MRALLLVSGLVLLLALFSFYLMGVMSRRVTNGVLDDRDRASAPSDLTRQAREADARRMAATMPPASRTVRWRNRIQVCGRRGHTYRVAFAPGYAHQCVDCGHVRAIDVLQVRA